MREREREKEKERKREREREKDRDTKLTNFNLLSFDGEHHLVRERSSLLLFLRRLSLPQGVYSVKFR